MFNRLQVRIVLILCAIALVFIAGFFIVNQWERNNLAKAVRDFEKQQHDLIHSIAVLNSNSTKSLSMDFSLWDEMVSFTKTRDTNWADINIKNALANYRTNQTWVFTRDFELLYYANDGQYKHSKFLFPDKTRLADIVKETPFMHFFLKSKDGMVEIFGAPIQPMADKKRITQPQGWLFAGMNWSESVLQDMVKMTSGKLLLDTSEAVNEAVGLLDENTATIHSNFVLQSWSGRPIATLRSTTTFPFLLEYRKGSQLFLIFSIIFILVLLTVISVILFRSVEIPLRYLNKTLEFRDIRYIEPLKNYRTDFGRLTRSVKTIFEKEELLQQTEKSRQLESELRKSEQRFHLLVENLPDILWIANAEGDTIYYSSNISNVLGFEPDELINNSTFWEKNIHPDDYQAVIDRYSSFVHENVKFEVEYRLKHKNGEYKWISEKAISKFELEGLQYCCGRLSDITEEKLVELELFNSEQKFRAIFEQNPFGVALLELTGQKMVKVNPALCEMLGYEKEEIYGKSLQEITPYDDLQLELKLAKEAHEKGNNIFTVEKRLYRKDGDLIWVKLTASYIKDKTGGNVYGFGIIENITEKKQIEDKLNREHNLLVLLMENVPDLIFFKNKEGKYITVNQAALDFYKKMGFSDPIGLMDSDIMGNQHHYDEIRNDENTIFKTGMAVINKPERIDMPDGEVIWFSVTKIPIFSPDGKNDIVVGILRNITERIENELKLKQYAQELKDLNLSKDKFVSILAHDLKNPFNAILGFSSVLVEEYDEYTEEERIHFIRNIHLAAENTYNLIQNILEWSRAQTGRIAFVPDYHDLGKIVDESIEILKPVMDEKEIQVSSTIGDHTMVFVDINMMKTILRNLVSNAVKFSEPGSLIRINCRPLNHGLLEVSIEDEGIGMPEEAIERLFKIDDSFRREGTSGEQGTGLGLILCKEFIERNGGLIWVSSKEGAGSRFMFTIPLSPLD